MNAPYLFLGLLCGLAIGYAFGWQLRRRTDKLRAQLPPRLGRPAGWGDQQYIAGLESVVATLRKDREVLHHVRMAVAEQGETPMSEPAMTVPDCVGGMPCTTCPDKRQCGKTGCARQPEFVCRPSVPTEASSGATGQDEHEPGAMNAQPAGEQP